MSDDEKKKEGLRKEEISKEDPEELFEMVDVIGEGFNIYFIYPI